MGACSATAAGTRNVGELGVTGCSEKHATVDPAYVLAWCSMIGMAPLPGNACRQRMAGVLAAEDIAAGYAAKRQVVGGALAKSAAATAAAAAADSASDAASAAAAAEGPPWSHLIAAVPGPLGAHHADQQNDAAGIGFGLEAPDRRQLQDDTSRQDGYLDQISGALNALQAMGMVSDGWECLW